MLREYTFTICEIKIHTHMYINLRKRILNIPFKNCELSDTVVYDNNNYCIYIIYIFGLVPISGTELLK